MSDKEALIRELLDRIRQMIAIRFTGKLSIEIDLREGGIGSVHYSIREQLCQPKTK